MKIQTERLELVALTADQLERWIYHREELEQMLKCFYQAEPVEGIFKDILEGQLSAVENDPDHYMWHSFWLLIRRSDRAVVGSADFKNIPDQKGEVEIGYGLGKEFEHHGYMTEAVKAMCNWAMKQPGVHHVTAETECDGLASQRLLQNCGFTEYSRGETLWWRL